MKLKANSALTNGNLVFVFMAAGHEDILGCIGNVGVGRLGRFDYSFN
jgi:hypothetical protein